MEESFLYFLSTRVTDRRFSRIHLPCTSQTEVEIQLHQFSIVLKVLLVGLFSHNLSHDPRAQILNPIWWTYVTWSPHINTQELVTVVNQYLQKPIVSITRQAVLLSP